MGGGTGRPRRPIGEGLTVPKGTLPRPIILGLANGVGSLSKRVERRERVGDEWVGWGPAGEKLRREGEGVGEALLLSWGEAGGDARRGERGGEGEPRTFLPPNGLRAAEGEGGGLGRLMEARGEEGVEPRIMEALGEVGGLRRIMWGECGAEGPRAREEGGLCGCSWRGGRGDAMGEEGGEKRLDITEGGLWALLVKPLRREGCGEALSLSGGIGEAMGEA